MSLFIVFFLGIWLGAQADVYAATLSNQPSECRIYVLDHADDQLVDHAPLMEQDVELIFPGSMGIFSRPVDHTAERHAPLFVSVLHPFVRYIRHLLPIRGPPSV